MVAFRAMFHRTSNSSVAFLGLLGVVVAATFAGSAHAQSNSATLNRFRPSELATDGFAVSRPDVGEVGRLDVQLYGDYSSNPLVFRPGGGGGDVSLVSDQLAGHLNISVGVHERVMVFAGLPVNLLMDGDDVSGLAGIAGADGFGMGDAFFGGRVRLAGHAGGAFALGASLAVFLPTAEWTNGDQRYSGDSTLGLAPELLAEGNFGGFRWAANLGAHIRPSALEIGSLTYGHEMTYGLGVSQGFLDEDALRVHADLFGAVNFEDWLGRSESPLELLVGPKYHHNSGLVVGAAAGPGITRGYGTPQFRAVATLAYVGETSDLPIKFVVDSDGDGVGDDDDSCVDVPEDIDGFEDEDGCPDLDNDGDGIEDSVDACVNDAEDMDGVNDEDGCPDNDDDMDGVPDDRDGCRAEPEDRDGFEDEDGCPDLDNDEDGVVDSHDRCPMEVGPHENHGCPDTDRDNDGVVDRLDNCPDVAGTAEQMGCLEKQLVQMEAGHLKILDKVYFQTGRANIQQRSFPLLVNVAKVLNAHGEITHVRVEGHTDSTGDHDGNVALSQARAESVVQYLVETGGVDAGRLVAHGYGPDRPVVQNASTREEHAQNRRVEFTIMEDDPMDEENPVHEESRQNQTPQLTSPKTQR